MICRGDTDPVKGRRVAAHRPATRSFSSPITLPASGCFPAVARRTWNAPKASRRQLRELRHA
jgi:hypothetical protein